jgi:MFS family permease
MSTIYSAGAARRITATLFVTQSLASAALIANTTVSSILGKELSGQPALAGLPGTLLLIGAALAAYPAGQLMQRAGRRPGLGLGFLVGFSGMLVAGAAVVVHDFLLFLLGLLLIGAARGAVDQSRYAAADVHPPDQRGKAISTVVFAGTVGAVGGPLLAPLVGGLVARLGFAPLSGPSFGGAALFLIAGVLVVVFLRPDPRDIARALSAAFPDSRYVEGRIRLPREIVRLPAVQLATIALVCGQVVMVLVMSIVPLHMHDHQHGLDTVSLVIMAHTLGMYGLSIATGALTDRLGRKAAIGIGAALLIGGSLLAPVSLMTPWLALALFLVGLGWNLCYIAGSSLLSDALAPGERGQIQGANDLAVSLASATGSLGSGVVMAAFGFTMVCLLSAGLATVPLVALGWRALSRARVVSTAPDV